MEELVAHDESCCRSIGRDRWHWRHKFANFGDSNAEFEFNVCQSDVVATTAAAAEFLCCKSWVSAYQVVRDNSTIVRAVAVVAHTWRSYSKEPPADTVGLRVWQAGCSRPESAGTGEG